MGSEKAEELTLPAEWTDEDDVPDELWVEGYRNGRALRDVDLILEFETDGDKVDDTVKVTVNPVVEYHLAENPIDPNLTSATGWVRARIEYRARANFKECPGSLYYVQTIDTSNWTLGYTAASGLPGVTYHYGGEPYTDTNGNGSHDAGEPYSDWDNNGSYTVEFSPPLLDSASNPPPAGSFAANIFYIQQQATDTVSGDYGEKADNDNPGIRWATLPNLAFLSTLDAQWDFTFYLVVRQNEHSESVIYPLAVLEWSVNWHTTFTAGSPNAPAAPAATTHQAATFNPGTPSPLISPVFNHSHAVGGGYR